MFPGRFQETWTLTFFKAKISSFYGEVSAFCDLYQDIEVVLATRVHHQSIILSINHQKKPEKGHHNFYIVLFCLTSVESKDSNQREHPAACSSLNSSLY